MKANSLINADELYLVEGDNEITITEATETESGLMSASDKVKLNGIEVGANKTIVDSALSSTSTNPIQNKVINSKFDEIKASVDSKVPSTRTVNGKKLSSNITLNASDVGALPDTTVIPSIKGLATETYVDNKVSGLINSAPEALDTLNELATALGNDPNFATTIATQIGGKVDKINGKGLSTNDYTTAEKNKLASIDESAEVNQNAFSNVIIGATTIAADNKTDSLTFVAGDNVTLTPDATNDKITISATDTTYGEAGTNLGLVKSGGDVTISSGIITVKDDSHNHTIGNIDNLQSTLDSKVDKVEGSRLITTSEASKLESLVIGEGGQIEISGKVNANNVEGLSELLDTKVDKVTGKGLSTNDYTTEEKEKLAGLDSANYVAKAGDTMTGKLTAPKIETGSNDANYFQSRKFRGEGDASNYYHAIDFGYKNHNQVDFYEYGGLWNFYKNTSSTKEGGTLCGAISANGWEGSAKLTGTPTAPTAKSGTNTTQIATTAFVQTAISNKVDKVDGKGLSTNDLTATLKSNYDTAYTHSQQAHAPSDAEKNIIVGIQKNGTNLSVDSTTRKVNIIVPTKTSDITNDSDYATNSSVDSKLSGKVDIVSGKGLSTNDYTTNEKTKLSGIAEGADVSTIKSISKNGTALSIDSSKNVNIEVPTKVSQLSNDSGYLTEHQNISGKADKATTLSGYGITDAYTQTQVDDKLSAKANKASTLAGYGITDAKISSGTITLGSNSITPVTDISGKQDKITGAATTITSSNLTTNRALISNGSGKVAVSDVTSTQLGYLNSVTSNVQSQLNAKAPLASPALTGTPTAPTADASVNNTQIATTAYVTTAINNVLNASNAMVFKGTIGENGSVTSLPTSHQVGDVYVVSTAGSYAGQNCEVGDMIVCTITGTASKNSDWTVVQSNINGAVTGPSSSVDSHVAIFDGSTGKIVKDSGFTIGKSVPANAVFTDTVYTHPSYTAKTGVPTANQTPSFGGKFTVTQPVSDATGHIVEMNSRTVTIPNTIASASANGLMTSADKTKLDTIAEGAEVNQNAFNKVTVGSTTIEADSKTDTLTIIAGNNVTLTPDATNDKITIASKDTIYKHPSYTATESKSTQTATHNGTITMIDNVTVNGTGHITGYNLKTVTLPADSDTHYESKNVVGATNATSNTSTALTNGNVYLNSVENGSVTSSHKISGSGATTVTTDTSGNIIISSTDNDTVYIHPSYTARTGVPTANQTPAFGGSFNISQPVSDSKGHITAINTRTVTIPNSVASTSANGLMSSNDKTKLDGISTSAKNIVVSSTQPTNQSVGDFWYKVV